MAPRQVDEKLLAQLRDRVGARAVEWRPAAKVIDVAPLTGGFSSLTFLVELSGVAADETPIVLKVAPPGLEPVRNRDVLRQAKLQRSLQGGQRTLAPDVLFSDPGQPPDVSPFMAMNLIAGDCVEPTLCADEKRPPPEQVRARYLDAAEMLARLHQIDPEQVGLGDEPVVGLADEIDRWTRAFSTLPAAMAGDYERAAKALRATLPAALPPVINHGDYRLGNTLCEGGRVNAIIDWEIWSVGDPRVDLAWLRYFTDDARHPAVAPGTTAGTPTRRELVTAYEQASGAGVPDLDWFDALTRYKEAGTTGLLLKRADKVGRTLSDSMERMRPALPELVREAISMVSG